MNNLKIQLVQTVRFLESVKIEYAVLGGVAVNVYGQPRFTADVDINILLNEGGVSGFVKKARAFGFKPAAVNIKAFSKKTGVIPMIFSLCGIKGRCDYIIAENELERSILSRAVTKKIGSKKIKFITPEDLIICKITSLRPHDREDVFGILARLRGKLDIRYIKTWLKRMDRIDKNLKSMILFERLLSEA